MVATHTAHCLNRFHVYAPTALHKNLAAIKINVRDNNYNFRSNKYNGIVGLYVQYMYIPHQQLLSAMLQDN